ncbi:hypothetical protein LTR62_000918 [Meristemomyces frigidus]|uniref:Uncharacterized protein n=1 Tax=Meristemomyces frigidus TaxID=1508187 RepID=A0AAN7T9T2_9PEZI|nr:hypothetical protein LTR62_000918 [Meristemomyces frigidus]
MESISYDDRSLLATPEATITIPKRLLVYGPGNSIIEARQFRPPLPTSSLNALTVLESATMTASGDAASTNALSILLEAAPSSVAQSVESALSSEYMAITSAFSLPSTTSSLSSRTVSPSAQPTISSDIETSTASVTPVSSLPSKLSTPSASTFMTVASQASSTSSSSSAASTTTAASTSHGAGQMKNASVVGISTGAAAAAVLLLLIAAFLWRRRSQGKAPFARRPSQSSSRRGSRHYPEEAWLYDPKMTPRAGSPPPEGRHIRDESATSLIPEPRRGTIELSSAPPSPPQHPTSPLLTPVLYPTGDERRSYSGSPSRERISSENSSPNGRRSRSSLAVSRMDLTRPMSAIWEEPGRAAVDARTGLLTPGWGGGVRHST